jgi:FkbM family methyltransferase
MFLSFVPPIRLRSRRAHYLWCLLRHATHLDDLVILADEDHLRPITEEEKTGRWEFQAHVEAALDLKHSALDSFPKDRLVTFDSKVVRAWLSEMRSPTHAWRRFISEFDADLALELEQAVRVVSERFPIHAVLQSVNCPSMVVAAERIGVPVAHIEVGPLRLPGYLPTGYFDLQGVNGNSEALARFRRWFKDPAKQVLSLEDLRALLQAQRFGEPADKHRYSVGVALQVPFDSNAVAFSRGYSADDAIEFARRYAADDRIIVRQHPSIKQPPMQALAIDPSYSSEVFLQQCDHVVSVNSGLLAEALLAGVPFTALGESPIEAASTPLDRPPLLSHEERDAWPTFYFINYLTPFPGAVSKNYIEWRLSKPTEAEIFERHLRSYRGLRQEALKPPQTSALAGPEPGPAPDTGVVTGPPLRIAYGQVFEDVFLERLFAGQAEGFYIDIGAWHPVKYSVSYPFYQRGWRGICVEPIERYARLSDRLRPRDLNLRCLVGSAAGDKTLLVAEGLDGLSTTVPDYAPLAEKLGAVMRPVVFSTRTLDDICSAHVEGPIDFMKIDVEGAEREVLEGCDWRRWRPRVIIVEATVPGTDIPAWHPWEGILLSNGYKFGLFDSLNRYYVAEECNDLLALLDAERNPWGEARYLYDFGPAAADAAHPDHDAASVLAQALLGNLAADIDAGARLLAADLPEQASPDVLRAIMAHRLLALEGLPPPNEGETVVAYVARLLSTPALSPLLGRLSAQLAR